MIPKHLFHYTSIDSLKKILISGAIRFKRLDLLNDPLESLFEKYRSFRSNVFSSSWTAESIESIPLWKMYSDFGGVRLKLPIDIFSFAKTPYLMKTNSGYWFIISDLNKDYRINRSCKMEESAENIEFMNTIRKVYGPTKIEYTSQAEELIKDVVDESGKDIDEVKTINMNVVGLRKTLVWSFENEFRFRVIFPDVPSIKAPYYVINLLLNNCKIIEEHIDIDYNKQKVDCFEILLGPKVTELEERELGEFLIETGFNYKLQKSTIKIK